MTGRQNRHARNRRASQPQQVASAAAVAVTVSLVATKMRITSPVPLVISGIPARILSLTNACTAIAQVSANVVDLTMAVTPIAGGAWTIPAGVNELRSLQGGFIAAAAGTF